MFGDGGTQIISFSVLRAYWPLSLKGFLKVPDTYGKLSGPMSPGSYLKYPRIFCNMKLDPNSLTKV